MRGTIKILESELKVQEVVFLASQVARWGTFNRVVNTMLSTKIKWQILINFSKMGEI